MVSMMAKVAVLRTTPKSVISDYESLMELADYKKTIPKSARTIVKINLSWSLYYPSCSTPPWQLDGVLKTLRDSGYKDLLAVENQTVVTHPWKGAYHNKWLPVLRKHDVKFQPLTDVKWVKFNPKSEMLAMHDIFGEILIPDIYRRTNVVHLPTVKTHGHTVMTGAMKNAFGGLIPKYRHHAHKNIHEILVDLLAIQKEVHKGLFAVMDGSVCGNGAGPRTMDPFIGNVILASDDQVAIDAIAAKIMGFEPLDIDYIRIAHERGLGMGDVDQIDIAGMDKKDVMSLNFGFKTSKSPIVLWDQILRKKTAKIKWMHHFLFNTPIFKTFIFASELYHDKIWYNLAGKKKIDEFMGTGWGDLFKKYKYGPYPKYTEVKEWNPY